MKKLIIFGDGQVADIFTHYFENDSDYEIVAYCVDDEYLKKKKSHLNKPIIGKKKIEKYFNKKDYEIFIALSYSKNNLIRKIKFNEFKKKGYKFAKYISTKSNLSYDMNLGENSAILENQSIQPFVKILNNVFVWSGTVIGHNSIIKSHSWITSGSNIGGNCKIGEQCFLGLNSTIVNMVNISSNCFIGANSLVSKNILKNRVLIEHDTPLSNMDIENFYRLTKFK